MMNCNGNGNCVFRKMDNSFPILSIFIKVPFNLGVNGNWIGKKGIGWELEKYNLFIFGKVWMCLKSGFHGLFSMEYFWILWNFDLPKKLQVRITA